MAMSIEDTKVLTNMTGVIAPHVRSMHDRLIWVASGPVMQALMANEDSRQKLILESIKDMFTQVAMSGEVRLPDEFKSVVCTVIQELFEPESIKREIETLLEVLDDLDDGDD